TTIADIDMYSRVHDMIHIFSATESRENDYSEGFANLKPEMLTIKLRRTNWVGIASCNLLTVFQSIMRNT
ncbi:MAG: hypothetical protein ACKO96_22240, partial [Flammeovirgaceae bacterium]